MAVHQSIADLVGDTPMLELQRLAQGCNGRVCVKLESHNPLGSVKDRIGLSMIRAAEDSGELKPGGALVEATSGNTGIALAYLGAARGYRVMLTMPDTMSIERRRLLSALGAELVLTPGPEGMSGAVTKAEELVRNTPAAVLMRQFQNPANPAMHEATTGEEILRDTGGRVDVFVAGVGTGGTITGVTRRLRKHNPELQAVAVEPDASPVLSGGSPGPHKIQGIGAGFVPEVLDTELLSEIMTVSVEDATETSRRLAKEEGILCGVSAGANVWAALQVARRESSKDKTIVTVICDTGERYLSTWLFEQ